MNNYQLLKSLIVVCPLFLFIYQPVLANEANLATNNSQKQLQVPPSSPSNDLLAQDTRATAIKITDVKLNPTSAGLEVVLTTNTGGILKPVTRNEGNTFISEIENAVLALPEGPGFQAMNPAVGIASVSVMQVNETTVKVSVTGTDAVPTAIVKLSEPAIAQQIKPTPPEAEKEEGEEEVVATGDRTPTFSTGSKTNTPLRDIPASIQIVPKELLKDQGAVNLDQGIRNVSGVQQSSTSNYGFANTYSIRGLTQTFLRDGVPDGLTVNGYFRTLTDVERVEVLKGPGSAIYGSLAPGGTINLVSKQPQSTPAYTIDLGVGSFDTYRGAIDLTGPITADKKWLYRFNAAVSTKSGYRGLNQETIEILPTITWKPHEDHTVVFDFDYRHIEVVADTYGIPFVGFKLLNVPPETRYYTPFATNVQDIYRGAISYEWKVNPDLIFRSNLTALYRDLSISRNASGGLFTGANNNIPADRLLRDQTDQALDLVFQTEVVWKVATGPIKHTLLAGLEYQRHDYNAVRDTLRFAPIANPFNPVLEQSRSNRLSIARAFDINLSADYFGVYLQDQIEFTPKLKARIGGRWDSFGTQRTGFVNTLNGNQSAVVSTFNQSLDSAPSRFSYQAGLVYQPIRELSLYGGVSKSHLGILSTEGIPVAAQLDPPESALQFEVGIKGEFLKGRLNAGLALFDNTREDFILVLNNVRQPVGAQKTRGIELDLSAEPVDGWKFFFNYALYDAKLTKLPNTPLLEGNSPTGVPRNSAALWTTYEFKKGTLKGFGFGGGLTYRDDIFQDQANTRVIPGYTTLDLALFYRRENYEFQLNFNNITDTQYFRNGVNTGALPGEPFNVQASVRLKF